MTRWPSSSNVEARAPPAPAPGRWASSTGCDLHLAPLEDVDARSPLEVGVEGLVGRGVEDEGRVSLGPGRAQRLGRELLLRVKAHQAGKAGALPPRRQRAGSVAGRGRHPSAPKQRPRDPGVDLPGGGESRRERPGRVAVRGGQPGEGRPRGAAEHVPRPVDLPRDHARGGEAEEQDDRDRHEERQQDDRDEGDEEVRDDELGPDAPEQAIRDPAEAAPDEPDGEEPEDEARGRADRIRQRPAGERDERVEEPHREGGGDDAAGPRGGEEGAGPGSEPDGRRAGSRGRSGCMREPNLAPQHFR